MKNLNKIVDGLIEDTIQAEFELNNCTNDELIQIIRLLLIKYKNLYVMMNIERINSSMINGEFDKILDNIIAQANNEELKPVERKYYQDFLLRFGEKKKCPPRDHHEPFIFNQ